MKVNFKVDKNALRKVTKEIEKEISRQIRIGECGMSKDAEKLLRFIVDEAKKLNAHAIGFNIKEIKSIPNVSIGINKLMNELEDCGMIRSPIMTLGGNARAYLTTDGIEYFENKDNTNRMDKSITVNVNGGQVNVANGSATINAIQNNGITASDLDNIIKEIKDNLSGLKKEDADTIIDTVDLVSEELMKPEPKISRLRNCITLIAPIITVANGIPALSANLQKLMEYIGSYIH